MPTNTTGSRVYRYCFCSGCEGAGLGAALITDTVVLQATASETRIDDPQKPRVFDALGSTKCWGAFCRTVQIWQQSTSLFAATLPSGPY